MAKAAKSRNEARHRRHMRSRSRINGTAEKPRMCVCTTGKHIYVQFVDDVQGHTVAQVSTLDKAMREQNVKSNLQGAEAIGKAAAARAQQAGFSRVVFDRGGFKYHGRVKSIADAARQAGLQF